MNWNNGKPTKSGYYWWRLGSDRTAHLIEVTIDQNGVVQTHLPEQLVETGFLVDTSGEWFGPVEVPR